MRLAAAKLSRADSAAAEIAFYLALSLVPLVGVAVALVSRWLPLGLTASMEEVLRSVLPIESKVAAGDVLRWARSSASQGWLTGGFAVALWTSFRFMSLCIGSLASISSVGKRSSGRAWYATARSLLLLAAWIVALVATALFLMIVPAIEAELFRLPQLSSLSLAAFSAVRAVLAGGILFGAIYLTYYVVVGKLASRLRVSVAALLAALGWIGASRGFSLIVPVLWQATQVYGVLGSVVLFLIWAYVMAWVLLLGGLLLAWPRRRAPRAASRNPPADRSVEPREPPGSPTCSLREDEKERERGS